MDAQVIAAIIAAAATLVGVHATYRLEKQKKREVQLTREKVELTLEKNASLTTLDDLGEQVPYEVREFEATTAFDEFGHGEHIRKWIGIICRESITNLKIPAKFWLSGGKNHRPTVEALPGSLLTAHFDVTHETDTMIDGNFVIDGLIRPGTGYVAFYATQRFERGFLLTKQQVHEAYKNEKWTTEYAVSEIRQRTQTLRRSVNFPTSHTKLSPPPFPVVFIGETEEVDDAEIERVQSGLSILDSSATLVVQNPKVGRRYGIAWMPPNTKTDNKNA